MSFVFTPHSSPSIPLHCELSPSFILLRFTDVPNTYPETSRVLQFSPTDDWLNLRIVHLIMSPSSDASLLSFSPRLLTAPILAFILPSRGKIIRFLVLDISLSFSLFASQ